MKMSFKLKHQTGAYLLLVIALFLLWAAWFEIDQVVHGQGQVIPQEKTQVIQAADGGVIQSLSISEGDFVKKGQLLAQLEDTRAQAGVDEISNRIAGLMVSRLRAEGEASGKMPDFGGYAQTHRDLVRAQSALYSQNINALKTEVKALSEQHALAKNEYAMMQRLYAAGDISHVELMRAERGVIDARQRKDGLEEKFKSEARRELTKIEDEITSQRSKLQERESIMGHTEVLAPLNGVVKSLRINTIGGVLRPGDEIMQISPTEGGYVIEAKINPSDIGQIHLGQPVSVRFDAFDYTIYGSLPGELTYLSSDTLVEQGSDGRSQVYYRAKVLVKPEIGSRIPAQNLKAGMTASIDILTDKRSILRYMTKPITRAFSGALGQK